MIEILCENLTVTPDSYVDWSTAIGVKIKDVVSLCYDKLNLSHFRRNGCALKPTHRYYRDFIALNKAVCPFCGINNYKNPLNPRREDFDHYLPKSIYPLAAANMDNLVPMCNECNQDVKKAKDVLFHNNNRVVAFYPFSALAGASIRVDSTVGSGPLFNRTWIVKFIPFKTEKLEVENWARTFGIQSRLENELMQFSHEWVLQAIEDQLGLKISTIQSFKELISTRFTSESKRAARRQEPKSLLKAAFYDYIHKRADSEYIKSFMRLHNDGV